MGEWIGRILKKVFAEVDEEVAEGSEEVSATPKNWDDIFVKEIDLFSSELNKYLQNGDEGKFVMYCKGNNIGVFEDYIKAFSKGRSAYEELPFIVFPIWEDVKEAIRYRNYFIPNEEVKEKTEEDLQKAS